MEVDDEHEVEIENQIVSEEYSPSLNPFSNPNIEHFPSLPQDYFDNVRNEEDVDEEEDDVVDFEHSRDLFNHSENTTHVSLNLSIDTLAKVKPVDITNVSLFLKEKEKETAYEHAIRDHIELEDANFFEQLKEDLSPNSKSGNRVVLYDPETGETMSSNHIVRGVQTDMSFSPLTNVECSSIMDADDEKPHLSPTNRVLLSPGFVSPIASSRTPTRVFRSPNFLMSPGVAMKGNRGEMEPDLNFLSPIRPNRTPMRQEAHIKSPDFTSPLFQQMEKKVVEPSNSAEPQLVEEQTNTSKVNSKRKPSVAKQLSFEAVDTDNKPSEEESGVFRSTSGNNIYLPVPSESKLANNPSLHGSIIDTTNNNDHNHGNNMDKQEDHISQHNRSASSLLTSHDVFRQNEAERKKSSASPLSHRFGLYSRTYDRNYYPTSRLSFPLSSYSDYYSSNSYARPFPSQQVYSRPLSPMNYEYFKARYRSQLQFLHEFEKSSRSFL